MEELKSVLLKLKEAADSKVQIARLEVFAWQKISSAVQEAAYYAGKWPEPRKPSKISVHELPSGPLKTYITIKEACHFLGLSRSTIYRLRSEGLIQYTKIGGHAVRYHLKDLEAYASQNTMSK